MFSSLLPQRLAGSFWSAASGLQKSLSRSRDSIISAPSCGVLSRPRVHKGVSWTGSLRDVECLPAGARQGVSCRLSPPRSFYLTSLPSLPLAGRQAFFDYPSVPSYVFYFLLGITPKESFFFPSFGSLRSQSSGWRDARDRLYFFLKSTPPS